MKWQLCLGGVLVSLLFCSPSFAEDYRACAVTSVEGDASLFRQGEGAQPLSLGMSIERADRIVTGPQSRAFVTCDDDTSVTIGAETEIDLGALLGPEEGQGYAARLFNGIAGFIFPSPTAERFEVRTPSAVASVRSTEWTVDVVTDGTSVFVREGRVSVMAENGGGELGPGQGIDIKLTGAPPPVKNWGEKRIVAMNARLGFAWQ